MDNWIETPRAQGRSLLVWEEKRHPASVPVPTARLMEVFDPHLELPLAQLDADASEPLTPQSFLRQAVPNALFYGDNVSMVAYLLANGWRNQVRLIYIDPPFDSGGGYSRKVRMRDERARMVGEVNEYDDSWHGDDYLQFMYERLLLLRELLADDGSLWLHCDHRQNHRLRMVLEEVFGEENYLNTIAWRSQVARGAKVNAFYFPFSTQFIEVFAKNRTAPTRWNPQKKRLVFTRRQAASQFMEDERGFFRTSDPGTYSFQRLKKLHAVGRIYAPYDGDVVVDEENERVYASNGGNIGIKYYLTRIGRNRFAVQRGVDNLWDDIPGLGTTPSEDVGYPTQKTEALLRRIIGAATNPGDWVLDCFAGSGTTPAVAQQMGRRWLAGDVNYGAVQTIRRRLQRGAKKHGPGFMIYRVDEAEDTGSDEKEYAVQSVADRVEAGATIEIQRCLNDNLRADVRIVDFVTGERMMEAPVREWRSLIEAVDIDPCYDGSVFRGLLSDAPQRKREQIQGRYVVSLPREETTIAVRITDIFGHEYLSTQVL